MTSSVSKVAKAIFPKLGLSLTSPNPGVFSGTWGGAGALLEKHSPVDGSLLGRVKQASPADYAKASAAAHAAFLEWRDLPAPKRGDILVRTAGVPVVVDSKSALYLKGTHLDYSGAMVAGGFKFSNPNAKASCSCGESFTV